MQRENDQSIAFQAVWRHGTSTVVILTKKYLGFLPSFLWGGQLCIFTIPLFTDIIAHQRLNGVKAIEMKDRKDLKTPARWQSCSNYKWNTSYCHGRVYCFSVAFFGCTVFWDSLHLHSWWAWNWYPSLSFLSVRIVNCLLSQLQLKTPKNNAWQYFLGIYLISQKIFYIIT